MLHPAALIACTRLAWSSDWPGRNALCCKNFCVSKGKKRKSKLRAVLLLLLVVVVPAAATTGATMTGSTMAGAR